VLNAAPARETAAELTSLIDVLVVNAVEADMMGGGRVEGLGEARRAAERLLGLVPAVIVTAGESGLAVAKRGAETATIAAHQVRAISTHGAGDAFIGALAAKLAAGETLSGAAIYANAAAAALVSTPEVSRSCLTASDSLRLLRG